MSTIDVFGGRQPVILCNRRMIRPTNVSSVIGKGNRSICAIAIARTGQGLLSVGLEDVLGQLQVGSIAVCCSV